MSIEFKYFGNKRNPDLLPIFPDHQVSKEDQIRAELSNFRAVFRDQVSKVIKGSGGLFRASIYENLPAQQAAFERLEECLSASNFPIASIMREESDNKEDVFFRVQTTIPVLPQNIPKIFTDKIPGNVKGVVFVSFILGVGKEFTELTKKNILMEKLDKELRDIQEGIEPSPAADPAFDPEVVIPVFLKNARLNRLYRYFETEHGGKICAKRYYQSPEGYLYRIEIDGYAAAQEVASLEECGD